MDKQKLDKQKLLDKFHAKNNLMGGTYELNVAIDGESAVLISVENKNKDNEDYCFPDEPCEKIRQGEWIYGKCN